MAGIFGDEHHGDRDHQGNRIPGKGRRDEIRHAYPGSRSHIVEIDSLNEEWSDLAPCRRATEQKCHQIAEDGAEEDRQPPDETTGVERGSEHSGDRDERKEHVGLGEPPGGTSEIQTDDGHDRTGHDRRHQRINPVGAKDLNSEPDQRIDNSGGDDTAVADCHAARNLDVSADPHVVADVDRVA
ncbi:MAG: hypothetical protein WKF81_14230, partial [Thermomicrobiales bacterium]